MVRRYLLPHSQHLAPLPYSPLSGFFSNAIAQSKYRHAVGRGNSPMLERAGSSPHSVVRCSPQPFREPCACLFTSGPPIRPRPIVPECANQKRISDNKSSRST